MICFRIGFAVKIHVYYTELSLFYTRGIAPSPKRPRGDADAESEPHTVG
ncbi:hypothetical protein BSP239C_00689 [Brevibacterium sp. 239c]|nr:hypothetical protein BSP239C_00689 [Brevibacterium sp. 239c]